MDSRSSVGEYISITAITLVLKYTMNYFKALQQAFCEIPVDKISWTEKWDFAPLCTVQPPSTTPMPAKGLKLGLVIGLVVAGCFETAFLVWLILAIRKRKQQTPQPGDSIITNELRVQDFNF